MRHRPVKLPRRQLGQQRGRRLQGESVSRFSRNEVGSDHLQVLRSRALHPQVRHRLAQSAERYWKTYLESLVQLFPSKVICFVH